MRTVRNIVIVTLVFIGSIPALLVVLSEILVYFEMWTTGAASRAELSEDYGLGLLLMFIGVPSSFVGALLIAWLTWRKISLRNDRNVSTA